MKVLLSAYACEPDKGSEPGVGWRWACGLASRVHLHVLTRESNRKVIERSVAASAPDDPLRTVEFHYHDLGPVALWLKRKGILSTTAYYVLWQRSACLRFAKLADSMDVVHHLTFCTLLCPGFWKLRHASYVLGPVGAPEVAASYLSLFGPKAPLEKLRGRVMGKFLHLPWLKNLLFEAKAVVPANSATRDLLISRGVAVREVMLDTGAPEVPECASGQRPEDVGCRFVYAGRIERRKGLELSIRAFAKAAASEDFEGSFELIGEGPDRPRLEAMVKELSIERLVSFTGAMTRDEVLRRFGEADAFLFSSVRDTSAGVNLEAMACGLPVVCLAHQGVADITTEACALRVAPTDIPATIDGLAEAIRVMAADREVRERMGMEARRRAFEDFSWSAKFDRMVGYYQGNSV